MPQVSKQTGKPSTSLLQGILKEITTFKGWEVVFKVTLSGFLIWGLYCLKILYDFHTHEQWAHIEKSSIADFRYSLVMVGFFFFYKKACSYIFFNIAKSHLSQTKFTTNEERNEKAEIHCHWIGSTIYYSASTITAFFLFKDQGFFPEQLGGIGEPLGMLSHWPHRPEITYGVAFYMVQFGKHLHTFVDHIIYKRKDFKFWEMFLHHSLAVFLIFFSYASNHMPIGILVLFVHDPCDVFFSINRLLNDSKYKTTAAQVAAYVIFLGSWVFFRLFAFPKSIIAAGFQYIALNRIPTISLMFYFMAFMLVGLLVLHFYWFVFILRAGTVMIFQKKSNINIYDKSAKKSEQ